MQHSTVILTQETFPKYFSILHFFYVTLDHKTSQKGNFFWSYESWMNKHSIDIGLWFVRIKHLESEGAKKI